MKKKFMIGFMLAFLLGFNPLIAQEKKIEEERFGYVSFSLGDSPVIPASTQELSLFGCETQLSTRGLTNPDGSKMLTWGKDNQVLQVPFGKRSTGTDEYFISQYYLASPPVMEILDAKTKIANIGLVIPDGFRLFGDKPLQRVYLDYTILEKVYLNYVQVSYDSIKRDGKSCRELGVDLVPLNIQCVDFPWDETAEVNNAKGASGIGRLRIDSSAEVFLLSQKEKADFLDCQITILDDILLKYDIYFKNLKGEEKKHLNLTEFYESTNQKGIIPLVCYQRKTPPKGCLPPN